MVPASIVPAAISVRVGGHGHLAAGFQRVEGGRERLGHQVQRRPETLASMAPAPVIKVGWVAAEAHQGKEQIRRRSLRKIGKLFNGQVIEPALNRGQHQGHRFRDEAGAAPGAVNGGPTPSAGRFDLGPMLRIHAARMMELAPGGHHVGARLQNAADFVVVAISRHVQHAIGLEREHRLDVRRGQDAGGRAIAELAGVVSGLVGGVDVESDQRQGRMIDHAPQ